MLFIIESPSKAKTISSILKKIYSNQKFKVVATYGHIKDLPKNNLGFIINNNSIKPFFVFLPYKKKIILSIAKVIKDYNKVILATDPDREGEAISFHIYQELLKYVKENKISVFFNRIFLNEITEDGLKRALENQSSINYSMVESQLTRRIIDRIIGYKVSPVLWRNFKQKGLSAGRVQTATLKIIFDRELEIENFEKQKFYLGKLKLKIDDKIFFANLYKNRSVYKIFDTKELENMKSLLKSLVNKRLPFNLVNTDKKILPPDPLKTSTLLQECAKLGISNKDTMAIAQKLYEGVDIDGQKVGVITYHRTDSVRISDYGVNLAKEILGKVNVFNRKNVSKFDAHEAIRITKSFPLDYLRKFLSSKEMKVYELIYNRFLASFCDPLKYVYQVLTCNLVDELSIIYESGKIKDGGFTKFLPNFIDNFSIFKNEFLDPKDSFLTILDFSIEEDYTKPPSRYTLSSIIKKMEQSGIGRPSTYSQTIEILKKRNYISLKKGSIFITDIGRKVIEFLFGKFSKYSSLLSVEFTSILEEVLDKIESSDFNEAKKIALENILRIYNELSSNDG